MSKPSFGDRAQIESFLRAQAEISRAHGVETLLCVVRTSEGTRVLSPLLDVDKVRSLLDHVAGMIQASPSELMATGVSSKGGNA